MTTEINIWVMPVRGGSPRGALEKALWSFRRENPRVEVRIWAIPWSTVWDRLMSALKGRHGVPAPDVLQVDVSWVGTLAYLGLLRELASFGPEKGDAVPALWDSCRLQPTGKRFAVPWTLDVRALRFRRDALEDTGLGEDALSTWEGVGELARRAVAQRRPLLRSSWGGEGVLAEMAPWVWAAGGSFFSADERRPAFLSEEALKAFAFYRELLSSARDGRGEPILDIDSLGAPLTSKAGVSPLPRGPAGRFGCVGGDALAVAAGTHHLEESETLLRHLVSTQARGTFAAEMGLLSPDLPSAEDAAGRASRECLSFARVLPPMVLLGSFERLFQRHLAPAARASAPWDAWRAALERAASETEVLLSHYEPPAP